MSTGCEYQLLNTCEDGIIEQSDENNMDTDQQEETTNGKKEEWMKPTDSFFASADSSAWASKAIVRMITGCHGDQVYITYNLIG